MTFEGFLIEKHAKQYVGTDDDMADDFDSWIEGLDQEQLMKYADKYAKTQFLTGRLEGMEYVQNIVREVIAK